MLGAALCSSAFAATAVTVNVTADNSPVDLSAYKETAESTPVNLLDGEHVITITMDNGTAINNGSTSLGDTRVQIGSITLNGTNSTAEFQATAGTYYGIVNSEYNQATLALNGGTLKKTGTGEMLIANTAADAGTLNLAEGSIRLLSKNNGTYALNGENLTLTAADGTTLRVDKQSRLKRFNSAGSVTLYAELSTGYLTLTSGSVTGTGTLKVNGNTTGNNDNIDVDLSRIQSAITLYQAKGTLEAASQGDITADIKLQNYNWAGANWNNVKGSSYTFTGAITCDVNDGGSMVFDGSSGKKAVAVTFTSDLSGWANSGNTDYKGLRSAKGMNLDVTISGDPVNKAIANAFNADNVSNKDTQNGLMSLTLDRDASIAGQIKVNNLTVNSGKEVSTSSNTVIIKNAITVKAGASLTMATSAAKTAESLTLGTGATLTLGTADSHNNDLNITGSLTVEGDSEHQTTLNANLVMNSGTLTFADGAVLTMGCDVTIGDTVTVMLTDTMVESIMAGNYVEIFSGVTHSYLSQNLTFSGSGDLSGYVTTHEAEYSLKQVGDKIYITPEPATATLSLLALAALAARRKRR